MPIGLLFWVLMIIWLIFGGLWWNNGSAWVAMAGAATCCCCSFCCSCWGGMTLASSFRVGMARPFTDAGGASDPEKCGDQHGIDGCNIIMPGPPSICNMLIRLPHTEARS